MGSYMELAELHGKELKQRRFMPKKAKAKSIAEAVDFALLP